MVVLKNVEALSLTCTTRVVSSQMLCTLTFSIFLRYGKHSVSHVLSCSFLCENYLFLLFIYVVFVIFILFLYYFRCFFIVLVYCQGCGGFWVGSVGFWVVPARFRVVPAKFKCLLFKYNKAWC